MKDSPQAHVRRSYPCTYIYASGKAKCAIFQRLAACTTVAWMMIGMGAMMSIRSSPCPTYRFAAEAMTVRSCGHRPYVPAFLGTGAPSRLRFSSASPSPSPLRPQFLCRSTIHPDSAGHRVWVDADAGIPRHGCASLRSSPRLGMTVGECASLCSSLRLGMTGTVMR